MRVLVEGACKSNWEKKNLVGELKGDFATYINTEADKHVPSSCSACVPGCAVAVCCTESRMAVTVTVKLQDTNTTIFV